MFRELSSCLDSQTEHGSGFLEGGKQYEKERRKEHVKDQIDQKKLNRENGHNR